MHRFIFETSVATVESFLAISSAYYIMDCSPDWKRFLTILTLFTLYYNSVVSIYTCIFTTKLGRSEARTLSFLLQSFLAITNGLWVNSDDTAFYHVISWLQNINPMYWVVSTIIRLNSEGRGECVTTGDHSQCISRLGDLFIEEIRLQDISISASLAFVIIIWATIRFIQIILLASDSFELSLSKHSKRSPK